jgi:hypothetical protein
MVPDDLSTELHVAIGDVKKRRREWEGNLTKINVRSEVLIVNMKITVF